MSILNKGTNFDYLNQSNIILISKVPHPSNLGNFRSISLCNVLYKMIAKMLFNRFKSVLSKFTDVAQSAFVPGRMISDNILLAYEIIHSFHQKRVGKKGFMAVKLDMNKAYDKVEWQFLNNMIIKMGFDW